MKNKIKKFSKGDFRTVHPEIVLPVTNLEMTIGEGESCQGSFILKNRKEGDIRGLVYSSSFRIHLEEQGFEGNPVELRFTYDGSGLAPGHVEQGKFTIVCNGGEFEVNFTAIIEKPSVETSCGRIQNIRDFKRLAMENFIEAHRLFRSRDFYDVIKYEEPRIKALYDNIRKWSLGEQAMEEFLVGIKQKECIFLTMGRNQRTFRNLKEATREIIHFTKNTWGFMPVKVHVSGDFIQIGRDNFTTDDFVGNLFDFSYIIHPEKAHAGNNYGQIVFESPYESLTYEVMLANHKDHAENRRVADKRIASIIKDFLACNAEGKDLTAWADATREKLKGLDIYSEDGDVYPLFDAHLNLLCKEPDKASGILDDYNYSRFSVNKDSVISSYYLYLTALLRKSGSQVNKAIEELNKAYMKEPTSWELVCMLIDIDPEYKNYSKKLQVLERHCSNGANQVILYWQAYRCFLEKPTCLKKLSAFEVQILNFAQKHGVLTKEIALYMANLASQQRTYDKNLDVVMQKVYRIFPDPQILTAICTHLIRGNRTTPECFKWYALAVKEDLKIAQLFEYYMMTVDDKYLDRQFPKSVLLYFRHGNTLEYKKAAVLYANLINCEEESSELYSAYREQMERFAWMQLENRRINDILHIIYKRCCTERDMTPERIRAVYDICHAYEIKTTVKNMAFVMVIEPDGTISQKVQYSADGVIVYLYNKDARIVWESKDGRHYIDSIPYETMRMFYENRYMEICKKYQEEHEEEERKKEKKELTWDMLREHGLEMADEKEVFKMCSMRLREEGTEEDDFLLALCFELFLKDQYDKQTLSYLAEYYCGSTRNMKKLWHVARDYDITTYKLSERIITQMLFSETMFGEEEIFADYYEGRTYFRLKRAYLAYVSREYVVNGRQVKGCIFVIIANEYRKEEDLPDICKIALLKYYSSREVHQELEPMLREFLREMCEKQLYFSFYLKYPENWLREVQLYDKTMIEYHAKPGSKVAISYQIRKGESDNMNYQEEILLPAYEDTYIKSFILFGDESLRYYFTETNKDKVTVTEKCDYKPREVRPIGKFGRLNDMTSLKNEALAIAMKEFATEKQLAEDIFVAY